MVLKGHGSLEARQQFRVEHLAEIGAIRTLQIFIDQDTHGTGSITLNQGLGCRFLRRRDALITRIVDKRADFMQSSLSGMIQRGRWVKYDGERFSVVYAVFLRRKSDSKIAAISLPCLKASS